MKYISVCSGIEAATVAWHHMGWTPAWFSEIEKFPCAVLAHHYPNVPNRGDMTKFNEWPDEAIDLLVGGTPCQSFSVAGLRRGLEDPRGNLMLTFLAIAGRYRPRWIVWENVPGVLSSGRGRDFGTFLGALGQLGYGWAYRVLDAQYFGVAQRRRRVFVVGYLGDWRRAAAVLFERESVSRDTVPIRTPRKEDPRALETVAARMRGFGDYECDGTASTVKQRDYKDATDLVAINSVESFAKTHKPVGDTDAEILAPVDVSPTITHWPRDHSDIGTGVAVTQPVAFHPTQDPISSDDGTTHAMGCGSKQGTATVAVAFEPGSISRLAAHGESGISPTLRAHMGDNQPAVRTFMQSGNSMPAVTQPMSVRRLTPRECERLQGFPDDYTDIKPKGKDTPDGPRYKALGNSMAVPVMRWIGERINAQEI